jgi:hypothetical protein
MFNNFSANRYVWINAGSNPAGGIDVYFECCVLSGSGLCDGPIPRPEESYWLWCVIVCDLQTLALARVGLLHQKINKASHKREQKAEGCKLAY